MQLIQEEESGKPSGPALKHDKTLREQNKHPMGFDFVTKIRQLFGFPGYKEKETQYPVVAGTAATKRDTGSQSARKRRNLKDQGERDFKYCRVDNTFPKFMHNDANDYDFVITGGSLNDRRSVNGRSASDTNADGSSTQIPYAPQSRRSIFNAPQTIQKRVRNQNVADVDLSDDEPNDRAMFEALSNRALSTNCARPSSSLSSTVAGACLNGHASKWYEPTHNNSIMRDEQRHERNLYVNLTNKLSLQDGCTQSPIRFDKPAPPRLHRISNSGGEWLSRFIESRAEERATINDAGLASRFKEQPPIMNKRSAPPLLRSDSLSSNSNTTSNSTLVGTNSTNSIASSPTSTASSISATKPSPEAAVIELDDSDDDSSEDNTGVVRKSKPANDKIPVPAPLRLVQTHALQYLLHASSFYSQSFLSNFSQKYGRKREEVDHDWGLAIAEAEKTTEKRRAFELGIRASQARLRQTHKPIFVLENLSIKEEPEPEFLPLTEEHLKRYNELVRGPGQQVLVTKFNLNITRNDIATLTGTHWLNDEVINFYMNLLTERSERKTEKLPSVYAMNTFFVPRLLQSGHSSVKRWTRKVDLFSKDIIPVPVHVGGVHWCMAIIHLKNKTIRYYDSMGKPNPAVLNALEMYLHEESLDKRKQPFDTRDFKIESVAGVPIQTNGSDCGVFSCMFAEYITRNKPLTFSQENMEYFRKKMVLEICAGELWK